MEDVSLEENILVSNTKDSFPPKQEIKCQISLTFCFYCF